MSKFEELCKAYSDAAESFENYKKECSKMAQDIIDELVEYIGIPRDKIFLMPPDGKLLPGQRPAIDDVMVLTDDTYYRFAISLLLCEGAVCNVNQRLNLVIMLKKVDTVFRLMVLRFPNAVEIPINYTKTDIQPFLDFVMDHIIMAYKNELNIFLKQGDITQTFPSIGFKVEDKGHNEPQVAV